MDFVNTAQDGEDVPDKPPMTNMWDEKQFLEVLRHYSGDEIIPKKLKKSEWAIFGKALINTFLSEKDLPLIDIYSQILRVDEMWSKPPHLLTFSEVNNLDEMSIYMFLTAKRAIGIDKNKVNERILQNTQIMQSISSPIGHMKMPRKKILGMF